MNTTFSTFLSELKKGKKDNNPKEKHKSFDSSDDETLTVEDDASDEDVEQTPVSGAEVAKKKVTKLDTFGVWAHMWGGRIRKVPESFEFPKGKILLSVWLSWHLPALDKKVCCKNNFYCLF